jgi:hypothetical protein
VGNSVRLPKEDADAEDLNAFYNKLGRPEDPKGYELVLPENLPEGVQVDDKLVDWFKDTAHKAGLSKTQATKLFNAWNEQQFQSAHDNQKAMGDQIERLKTQWGDQFEGRVELGLRAIERILPANDAEEFKDLLDKTGLGNSPIMLKFAYQVGNMLKADGYITDSGTGGALGAEGAKKKIESINADKSHAYWDEANPEHNNAVKEMSDLFKIAFPT